MEKQHWRPEPNNLGVETWRQYADSSPCTDGGNRLTCLFIQ